MTMHFVGGLMTCETLKQESAYVYVPYLYTERSEMVVRARRLTKYLCGAVRCSALHHKGHHVHLLHVLLPQHRN